MHMESHCLHTFSENHQQSSSPRLGRHYCLVLAVVLLFPVLAAGTTPVINSLTPNTGAVGSAVVIAGSNFGNSQSKASVTFNGTRATITSFSSTSITATVPTGATTGNVIVTISGTASNGVSFTVTAAPNISSLTPNTGAIGSSVVIAGSNFGPSQGNGNVKFNGTLATVTGWNATQITATVPSGATTGNVVVTAAGGVASNGVSFTVTPAPSISSLTPNTGAVGSSIVIAGSNFGPSQGNGNVKFNGTLATVTGWNATQITATVPSGATTGNVVVTAAGGVASNGVLFTVTPASSITSLTPNSGAIGSAIVIAGSNFGPSQGNGSVTFNGTSATVTGWNATQITATVPSGSTTGNVVVTAAGGIASNGVSFTVTPAPSITSLTPNTGAVGSVIVIAGSNFGPLQGNGSVTFNGTSATVTGWNATQITATVPSGATTGNVVATAAGGIASTGVLFTVTGAPSISSLTPNSGAVGSSIVIAGSNFGLSQGNGSITFSGVSATVTAWSATQVTATVPTGAVTGNVVVTAAGGVASNGVSFTVAGAPSITSLTPNNGAVGSSVTIAGANFGGTQGNGGVTFNGTATTVTNWTAGSITATVPIGATTGNVVVTAAGGVQSNGLTFTVAPIITSLNPNSGVAGTTVNISGSNFTSTAGTVSFNGASATVSSWSNNSVVAMAPNGLASGNVVVTTAGGTASNGVFFALSGQVFSGPVTYSYDELGRLVGAVAATGDAVQYSYDPVGNIAAITRFTASQEALFSFTPKSGPVGTQVTISGANFSATAAQDTVSFNGASATINSASANSLVVSVPSGAASGPITVSSPNGSVTGGESFTVTTSASGPTISSITPQVVAAGGSVTISGTNFDSTLQNNQLIVNTTAAATTSPANSTTLTMTVPANAGSGHIYLNTPAGSTASRSDLYIPPSAYTVSQVAYTGRTTFGNSVTMTLPANDIGMLLFDGIAGHRLSISVTSSNISNGRLQLYNPNNVATFPMTSVSGTAFIQPETLPMTGTYAIVIFAANGSSGSITLSFYDVPPDVTGTIVPNGPAVTIATAAPGQKAYYTFQGSANELVTAVMDSSTYTNYFNVQGVFQIIAPDGTVVRSFNAPLSGVSWLDDVNYCTNNSLNYPCASSPYVLLPSTGTYTLYLNPPGWSVGQLRIGLFGFASDITTATTAGTAASPAIPVSMATAGQNARITFPVDMTQQQRVSFAFTGLSMSSVTGEFTPSVNFMVLDSTGVPIGGFANSGQVFTYGSGTSSAYAEFANNLLFQNSGTYTLWIDPVKDITASLNVTVYDATDKSVTAAADATSHSLTTTAPGQNFSFNFPGTQGQRVSALVSNLSGLTSPGLKVNLLEQWNNKGAGFQDGSNYFIDTVTLGATDTFNVYVDPASTDIGSATATIYTVPADFSSTIDTVGDPVVVTTTTPGQNAQLTFTAPNPNPGLTIQMTNGSYPAGKCSITMSAPGGGGFNIGDCSGSTQTWNFPNLGPAGTYTININPLLSATGSATFSVTLH